MNTTFLTWLTVAAVVGGALLLFLGMPASVQEPPLVLETVSTDAVRAIDETYWEPVALPTTVQHVVPVDERDANTALHATPPCRTCGTATPVIAPVYTQPASVPPCGICGAVQPSYRQPGQRCGSCGAIQQAASQRELGQACNSCGSSQVPSYVPAPVARATSQTCTSCGMAQQMAPYPPTAGHQVASHACSSCGTMATSSVVPIYMQYPNVASCEQRVPCPCGATPCSGLSMNCGSPCGSTCSLDKPGINRNMELCVEECTFVQLHTTMPHPICSDVRFEWTTSKGSFLDSNAADPIYYVPTTQFADGEDVWVVVKITDSLGASYTDQLKLHVVNQR